MQRTQRAQSFLALHFTSEDGQLGREDNPSRPNIWEQGWKSLNLNSTAAVA